MTTIYHITPRAEWERAQALGAYRGDTLDTQGFIHCSTAAQVVRVANAFYAARSGLVLLCIDSARVQPAVRYEAADGDLFPHIYGPLNLAAVKRVLDFAPRADGTFVLPAEIGEPSDA